MKIKKFLSYFLVLSFCLILLSFSVSAESTGPTFFDFDEYATYEPLPDTNEVKAIIDLPTSWYITYLSGMDLPPMFGDYCAFPVEGIFGPFSVHTSPFGCLWNYYDYVGSNTHFLDLSLMPKDFMLYGGFEFQYYGEFNYQNDWSEVYILCFNEQGEFVDTLLAEAYLSIFDDNYGNVIGEYEFVFDSSILLESVSDDIKGIAIQFDLGLFLNAGSEYSPLEIIMNPFEMDFFMDNAFINNRNQKIIRDKLSNMEKQLGDIDNKLDSAINGEVTPEESPVQGEVDDMLQKEDELLGSTEAGRENVIVYITQAIAELSAYFTAFVALNSLIDAFFFLPIIGPLITISLALGIFALIVNLAQTMDRADRVKKSRSNNKGG